MPTSDARIIANQLNAARSTGPRTDEGKERSRANSYKHGMTGAGVVLPEADAIEVERRSTAFVEELNATGEVQVSLARRAALSAVRMERGADQKTAALSVRYRQVEADFVPPDGVTAEEADQLRAEVVRASMFDPSKEARLARQYEAAAERGFFRALKELRQLQKSAKVEPKMTIAAQMDAALGSFLKLQEAARQSDAEDDEFFAGFEAAYPETPSQTPQTPRSIRGVDIPITVGRAR